MSILGLNSPKPAHRRGTKQRLSQQKRRALSRHLQHESLEARHLMATFVWDGGGANSNWNTAANWVGNVAPGAGDDLVFTGNVRTTNVNNYAGATTFNSITFDASAGNFSISGNFVNIGTGITSAKGTQTISFVIGITPGTAGTMDVASGTLKLADQIQGAGSALIKAGAGTLILSGNNTFNSGLTIKEGTVSSEVNQYALGRGSITVGDSSGNKDATVNRAYSGTHTNPITIASGNTGKATISATASGTFSGAITLNSHDVTFYSSVNSNYITGGVTGTGDIAFDYVSNAQVIVATGSLNNVGSLTSKGTGTFGVQILSSIGSNVTSVIHDSPTSVLLLQAANSFTGGLIIKAGKVRTQSTYASSAFGSGTITIGDSSGNRDATLAYWGGTIPNAISVAAGNTGIAKIESGSGALNNVTSFSGSISLNSHDLVISNPTTSGQALSFSGGITGSGNVYLQSDNATGTGGILLKTTTVNHSGAIINSGTGISTSTVSAIVGANVTAIIQDSTTSAMTISGAVWLSGGGSKSIRNDAGVKSLTVSLGVTGNGSLVVENNSSTPNAIVIGGINNTGTVTNAGTGSGILTINSVIGTNVTGVVQNSATSALVLAGANTYTSGTTVLAGQLSLSGSGTFGASSGALTVNGATAVADLNASSRTAGAVTVKNGGAINNGTLTGTSYSVESGSIGAVLAGSGVVLTKTTSGTVTLSGANTYTGATNVTAGVLELAGAGTISTSSAIAIESSATLKLSRSDTWGSHTSTASSPINVKAGGTLETNNSFNTITDLTLSGGTILLNGGSTADLPALALRGTVTVNGSTASQIVVGTGSHNYINIGNVATAGATVFDVADVTSDASADLVVGAVLKNTRDTPNTADQVSDLTKSGVGTLNLTADNTYTGDTNINAGTLIAASNNNNGDSKLGRGTITIDNSATLIVTGSNVFGTGAGIPTQLVINAGGVMTSGDSAFAQLPAVELNGGTIASGKPHPYWGSWAFSDGIAGVGLVTSTLAGKNMYIPAGEEIVTATGAKVELTGDFSGSAGYGVSTVVVGGTGTVANTQAKQQYRFTEPKFFLGSSAAVYEYASGTPLPLANADWITAGTLAEAVRQAFTVTLNVNGSAFSFGGAYNSLNFEVTTYGAVKDLPTYAGPTLTNLDTVIIRFEDWTDWDLNDAYIVFGGEDDTGESGYEHQAIPSEDFGYVCTCDCGCSSATTSPTGNSEVKEKKTAYDSGTVNPKSTVSVTAEIPADQGTPDLIEVQLTFDGVSQPTVFLDPTGLNPGDSFVAAAQADSSTRDTGRYAWNMKVVSHYGSAKFEDNFDGFQDVINRTSSEFGPGWQMNELDQLLLTAEGVNLITGTNQAIWFEKQGGDYQVESGNSQIESLVKQLDDSFTLTFKDGSRSEFSSTGLLTSRVDASGNTRAYSYADEDGDSVVDELSSILDEQGRTTTLAYTSGLLTSLTDYAGEVTSYGYNLAGQLASITEPDPDGAGVQTAPVWQYTYDATSGLLDSIEDPRALVTNISYDFTQRVSAIEQACGGTTAVDPYYTRGVVDLTLTGYDASHPAPIVPIDGLVEYQEDERGNPSWIERDHRGNIIRETNALNETTTYRRDVNGLVTLLTQPDPDGAGPLSALITSFNYDDRGNLLKRVNPDGSSESWTYDATFSQVTKYTDALNRVTKYAIDPANGNVLSVTQVVGLDDAASSETDDVTTSYTYTDGTGGIPAGLLASQTDPLGRVTEMVYDTAGLLLSVTVAVGTADEATTAYEYDARDNVSAVIDPLGRRTEYLYDSLDRLIEQTDPDPDGVGPLTSPVWSYLYDARGNQTQVTDPPGNVTQYVYDDRNRVEQMIAADPDGAGPLTSPITSYVYDCVSNLTSVTDPLGRVTTYTYDELNRLQTTTLPDPDGAGPLASPVTSQTYDSVGNLATSTDALGNVTTYRYDALNRVVEITQPDPDGAGPLSSPVTQYEYDAAGQLLSTIDPLGRITSYEYDDLGRLVKTTLQDPDGAGVQTAPEVTTTYDAVGNLLTRTDALGNVTTYEYDALNRLVELTQPDPDGVGVQTSPVTSYVYDLVGQLLSSTDPLGRVTSYAYDDLGRQISVTQPDPDGAGPLASPITSSSYDAMGNLLESTDPLGNVTTYEYDHLHRRISVTQADPDGVGPLTAPVSTWDYDAAGQLLSNTDPLGRVTSYTYDDLGRQASVTQPDPDGAGPLASPVTSYSYDAMGNLLESTDPLGNVTTYEYDQLYRRISITQADPDGAGPLAAPVSGWEYDAAGQLLSSTDPLGRITSFAYDDLGRQLSVTQPDPDGAGPLASPVTNYSYDAVGNLLETTDPLGNVTTYTYDNLYRLVQEEQPDPDGIGALTRPTTVYAYDAVGNRLTLTDPVGNTTTWTYDALNRLLTDTNELGKTRSFVYDAANNLVERTDRNGRVIEYVYDNLHRNIEENWLDSMSAVIRTLSFEYDAAGYLTTASDPTATYTYDYDGLGRTITETQTIAGLSPTITLTRGYDAAGNRTELTAALGVNDDYRNTYAYDALHRLTSLQQAGQLGGNTVAEKRFDFAYNSAGQFTALDRYADLAGSEFVANTAYSYDGLGRLASLQHSQGVTSLAGYDYTYDAASRITAINSVLDGLTDYTNDATGQLTEADHTGQADEAYSYDENGNRVTSTVGTNNRILSDGTFDYEYDDEGNMVAKEAIATGERVEYAWDHRNRLISIVNKDALGAVTQQVDQAYDVFQRWVQRSVDSDGAGPASATDTFFTYEGNQIALEFDGNTASDLTHRYLWGDMVDQILADEQVSSLASAGDVIYPLTDHLNTTRDLATYDAGTDITTNANHRRFDSFGNLISQTNGSITILVGFTARPLDVTTGLQWNLNRWYASTLGTWMSEDPIGFKAMDANVRRYVGNWVIGRTDPTGLFTWKLGSEGHVYAIAEAGDSLRDLANQGYDLSKIPNRASLGDKQLYGGEAIDVTGHFNSVTQRLLGKQQNEVLTSAQLKQVLADVDERIDSPDDFSPEQVKAAKQLKRKLESLRGKVTFGDLDGYLVINSSDRHNWFQYQGNCHGFTALVKGWLSPISGNDPNDLSVVTVPPNSTFKEGYFCPDTAGEYRYTYSEGWFGKVTSASKEVKNPKFMDVFIIPGTDNLPLSNANITHSGIVLGTSRDGSVYVLEKPTFEAFYNVKVLNPVFLPKYYR